MSAIATRTEGTRKESSETGARDSGASSRAWALFDVGLAVSGLLVGLVSLTYPFGRDQGLYYYVAREWVLRGKMPYRDVLDHKTPGIYLLHALSIRLFGETMWGIRVFELAGALALGFVLAWGVTPRGRRVPRGLGGASVLAISVFYWGFLDFWNTAQSELWYAGLGTAAVITAVKLKTIERAALATGLLSGAAVIMKPPAVWFVLLATLILAGRVRGDLAPRWSLREVVAKAWRPTAMLSLGLLAVPVPVLGYFAARGAIADLVDVCVGANGYYVRHEAGVASPVEAILGALRIYAPFSAILVLGLAFGAGFAYRRRDFTRLRGYALAAAVVTVGWLAMAMQAKFYLLHWVTLVPTGAFAAATLLYDWLTFDDAESRGRPHMASLAAGVGALLFAWVTSGGFGFWCWTVDGAAQFLGGKMSREAYASRFAEPAIGFFFADSQAVGDWLREHSRPDDPIMVRGFQPEIYAIAGRRHAGRFFWTTFLTSPVRAYRREEWLAQDKSDYERTPPRFIVALRDVPFGLDAPEYYAPLGYVERTRIGPFVVLGRGSDAEGVPSAPST